MDFVGYVTFTRTYARKVDPEDVNSPVENWPQAIQRIVTACKNQLNVGFTAQEEHEVTNMMLQLKGLPAGRFLWQLGTETVSKLGLLSLQNCAFCIIDSPVRPFTWAMDCLMLGSGVGFNLAPEHLSKLPSVQPHQLHITRLDTKDADFIVPDSREGWVKLLGKVLKAHFYSGRNFTYSTTLLRSSGAAIKGFGGSASGPEILCKGVHLISQVLNQSAGRQLRSVDALDIMNIIGMIVVAGNVRRSAQIALGVAPDTYFLRAKRWDLGNIPNWRCNSNNSILCNNINDLPAEFWEGYQGNGEPYGLINLPLSKLCGRLGETHYPDPDVEGYNPCAEQSLANFETCALGELVLPRMASKEDLFRCAQLLYRMIKHSLRLPCHHPETEAIVHKNMRMGIGITGYLQATEEQRSWLAETYVRLRAYDVEYSAAHGWPTSIKLTTVKPSGTLSLLAGCTSGVHPGYARQYIRRIRFAAESPLVPICRSHGYHVEFVRQFDGSIDRSTVVVQFPYKLPDSAIVASQVTALDQLNFVKRLQTEWSDNSVSCCLTGDSLVHSSQGFKFLEDICREGSQLGETNFYKHKLSVVSLTGKLQASNAYYLNGQSSTVKLYLSNGSNIQGTGDHRVQVIQERTRSIEWCKLKDVTVNMYIVSRVGLNIWPTDTVVHLHDQQVNFVKCASIYAVNMMSCAHWTAQSFGQLITLLEPVLSNVSEPALFADMLQTEWGSLGTTGIPKFVMEGSRQVVMTYLSAVFFYTHEMFCNDKCTFLLMARYNTAVVLQSLLNNLGVVSNIVPCDNASGVYNLLVTGEPMASLMCSLFFSTSYTDFEVEWFERVHPTRSFKAFYHEYADSFHTEQQEVELTGYVPEMGLRTSFYCDVLPRLKAREHKKRMATACNHHDLNLDRQTLAQMCDFAGPDWLASFSDFLDPSFMFYRVTNVVFPLELVPTFDVSVPVTNSYLIQSGVVSHNTVYYRKQELPQIQAWLADNYEHSVKTCSFLLHNDHGFDQAPLEEITEERYREMVAATREFSLGQQQQQQVLEETEEVAEVDCPGGACPVR
jgi:ribonucleoside-triphosphate reductase